MLNTTRLPGIMLRSDTYPLSWPAYPNPQLRHAGANEQWLLRIGMALPKFA